MDFGKLDVTDKANEGVWMTVCDLEGSDTDAKIKVVGTDSKIHNKRIQRIADISRKKKNGLKAAELEREMLETYAACSVDFEKCFIGKKEIKAENFEDIIDFYKRFRFVLDQVVEFANDRSNFLPS